ncbi:MAG: outer membrane protein transport protein [bacterium]
MMGNRARRARCGAVVALAALLCLAAPPVSAGGITRPNTNGARAVGLAGAYTAVADDALSIFHNPAGLGRMKNADLVLSAELVFVMRSYTPPGRPTEKAAVSPLPLPFVAGGARIQVGENSFLAMGAGIYNAGGGSVSFDKNKVTEGVITSLIALFEFTPTLAYQVHRRVFIGASLRMGLGAFSAFQACSELVQCAHDPPGDPVFETRVSPMFAMGFGYALGIQVLPTDWLGIGVTYKSNLKVKFSKKNAVDSGGLKFDASVEIPFPQSVSFGVFVRPSKRVLVAAQFDWVDNSQLREIFIDVDGWVYGRAAIATDLYMKDSFAAHLGTEITVNKLLVLRGGMAYDSQSIPDKYTTRGLSDGHKLTWNLGATLRFGRWRLDLAAELAMADVSQGFKSVTYPSGEGYAAPGIHHPGGTFSFHLGGGVAW